MHSSDKGGKRQRNESKKKKARKKEAKFVGLQENFVKGKRKVTGLIKGKVWKKIIPLRRGGRQS